MNKNQDGGWIGSVNAGLQFSFRDEKYSRPLNTNFYLQKPLILPSSWGNENKGGIDIFLKGKSVLVNGAGMLGIIACAMASKMGAAKIIAIDQNKERLEISRNFGATEIYLPNESLQDKVDIVLEFSGDIDAMENSIQLLNIGGTAIWIGAVFAQPAVQINAEYIIRNLITIKGLHNYNNEDFINAVSFMEMNHKNFEFEQLIKKGFVLEEVEAAFEYAVYHNPFRVSIDLT